MDPGRRRPRRPRRLPASSDVTKSSIWRENSSRRRHHLDRVRATTKLGRYHVPVRTLSEAQEANWLGRRLNPPWSSRPVWRHRQSAHGPPRDDWRSRTLRKCSPSSIPPPRNQGDPSGSTKEPQPPRLRARPGPRFTRIAGCLIALFPQDRRNTDRRQRVVGADRCRPTRPRPPVDDPRRRYVARAGASGGGCGLGSGGGHLRRINVGSGGRRK